ncbi:MAG TPA: SIMPL domain-containing protein [Alphaproteobacteria bacterium]
MRLSIALMSVALLATFTLPAFADDDNIIDLPPAGHTIINLSVTERTKLAQDTLNATLNYQLDGASANEIQDKINKATAAAVAEAKKVSSVKTTTGSYYVYEYQDQSTIDPKTGQPFTAKKLWRGQQSISLESENSAALLDLAGKIQSMGFTMQGLNYSLSPEKADGVRDNLMQKALTQLGAKAKIAATALGKSSYDVIDVSVDGAMPYNPPVAYRSMAKMEMAADAVAAPVAEAGESEVTLTVNARVLLKP